MNSWNKSDSVNCNHYEGSCSNCHNYKTVCNNNQCSWFPYIIGENDMKLAQKLILGGTEHRKFMRQIMVSVDITAPLYWWKEFCTYKIGTVENSTSTMHMLASTPITMDCFETDDYCEALEWYQPTTPTYYTTTSLMYTIPSIMFFLEGLRKKYIETKDKRYWKELIRWLPESYLQTRTVTMNYENLRNMYFQRRNHKLNEWSGKNDPTKENFCKWVETLPYAKELIMYEGE